MWMYDRTTVRQYDHMTIQLYDHMTAQRATFKMHGQLYCRHANTMALSSSPVVSALGSKLDDPHVSNVSSAFRLGLINILNFYYLSGYIVEIDILKHNPHSPTHFQCRPVSLAYFHYCFSMRLPLRTTKQKALHSQDLAIFFDQEWSKKKENLTGS